MTTENQETPQIENDGEEIVEETKEPTKAKIRFESSLSREEAVSYFEAIVAGIRSGTVEFRQEDKTVVLHPGSQLDIGVKASRKGDKAKIAFEIAWRGDADEPKLAILPS